MTDFGRIRPLYGQWRWPYRQMEEGDEFHVSYEDRAPEDVRQLASVRAAQLGIRLSCRRDDNAGIIRVTRVPFDTDSVNVLPKALTYEQLRPLLRNLYSLDADDFPWWHIIEPGESYALAAKRKGDDPRKVIEADVAQYRYAVELLDDRIKATCLAKGESLEDWKAKQVVAMME